jgi:hypothetical protein
MLNNSIVGEIKARGINLGTPRQVLALGESGLGTHNFTRAYFAGANIHQR